MTALTADLETDIKIRQAPGAKEGFPELNAEQTEDGGFRRQRN